MNVVRHVFPWLVRAMPAAAILAAAAPAQQATLVVPAWYDNTEAPGAVMWAFSPFSARRQLLIGPSHLSPALNQTLRAVEVRRNARSNESLGAGLVYVKLTLSHSPRSADDPSPVFEANVGPDQTTVFSGVVSLPAITPPTSTPVPWSTPYAITIAFQRAFTYTGGTLCLEAVTTEMPRGKTAGPWWPIDADVQQAMGMSVGFGTNCIAGAEAGAEPGSLVLGSTAVFYLEGTLAGGSSGLCFIGTSSVSFGGLALPIDLSPVGAPGCFVNIDLLVGAPEPAVALPGSQLAIATHRVGVPLVPALSGQDVYSQWIWPEPGANALGVAFSNGVRATLAGPVQLGDVSWIESVDLASPDGEVLRGRIPVLRFRM